MKRPRRILSVILSAAVLYICLGLGTAINAFALGEAEFHIPSGAVSAGESFEVSVSFYATDNIGNIQTSLSYDENVVEFVSGDNASGGGGLLTVNGFPDSQSKELTFTFTFKGLKSGVAAMSLVNCNIYSDSGDLIGSPTAYANITVAEVATVTTSQTVTSAVTTTTTTSEPVTESSTSTETEAETDTQTETSVSDDSVPETSQQNTAVGMPDKGVLTSLTVSSGTLTPEFAYNVYDYTVYVDNSVSYVEIEGTTASKSDYIWYSGTNECQVGSNVRTISVTDTDGNKTTYTVTIIRAEGESTAVQSQQSVDSTGDDGQAAVTKNTTAAITKSSDSDNVMDKYKDILNSALAMILIVLVIALVVIIIWIRGKIKAEKSAKETKKQSNTKNRKGKKSK
jgi:hypothetical protein